MEGGLLLVMSISNGSSLAVLASSDCDMGLVAYEMTLLVERVGRALTPGASGRVAVPRRQNLAGAVRGRTHATLLERLPSGLRKLGPPAW